MDTRHEARLRRHLLLVFVIVAVGLFLFPVFRGPGAAVDEGELLAYPQLVMRGNVPYRDFVTFYGPGAPYVLAGGYRLFGTNQTAERAIGMTFRIVAVAAVYWLFVSSGTAVAAFAALVAGLGLRTLGPSASAAGAALASGLLSLALLAHARRGGSPRLSPRLASLLGGLAGGICLLFRFDFIVALLLGSAPLVIGADRAARRCWLAGVLIGPLLYIPVIWLTGLHRMRGVVADVLRIQPDRHLPLPAVTSGDGLTFIASLAAILLAVVVAFRLKDLRFPDIRGPLLAGALFALGLVPYFLSRADPSHLAPLRTVALATGVVAAVELARWRSAVVNRLLGRAGGIAVLAATAVVAGLGILALTGRGPSGLRVPANVKLTHDQRSFRIQAGPAAHDVQAVLDRVDRYARPGQRLLVGTTDLRYAEYNDTFLYYLLPRLRPATHYLEFAPRMVNRRGSELTRDLAKADILILTSQYNAEARGHRKGPMEPNELVARRFCSRFVQGTYELLVRCR